LAEGAGFDGAGLCAQTVTIGPRRFEFAVDEHLRTEYSHKYTIEGFAEMAAKTGFSLRKSWTDAAQLFALLHLVHDTD
jgi:uncharacterized SAM-dependent methyltransferase